MSMRILQGDCREVLKTLPDCSVDSIVTDPPYHLTTGKKGGTGEASASLKTPHGRARVTTGFMGMTWDGGDVAQDPAMWAECLRVLKPGGYLLAFSGTRTYHRMAVAIEDAGFEIRDQLGWLYGSGFPKSHNGEWGGTALKPAWEPICMARKALVGTVEANWRQHGTGALNIDGCRIGSEPSPSAAMRASGKAPSSCKPGEYGDTIQNRISPERWLEPKPGEQLGRWPANVLHDGSDEVVAAFPDAIGAQGDVRGTEPSRTGDESTVCYGKFAGRVAQAARKDGGSAARFFMQCKGDYNDAWQDLNLPQENANTAEQGSSQQRQAAVSALVLAVSSALPEGLLCSGLSMAPFTSATANELRLIAETATQTIQTIGSKFWRESKPARLSLSLNHASDAEIQRLTDTTTITVSRWKSDGSAEPVTFSITPMSLEVGGKDCAPSMDGKRFMYCAKASKSDRGEGNHHPTVKPTDLMRYLCRLVTPAGGVVLDPFMGSGSTLKAAELEGFSGIGIELSPDYIAIAKRRIAGDAPLFADVEVA